MLHLSQTPIFVASPQGDPCTLVQTLVKNLPAIQTWIQSLVQEDPWRREWQPTPAFLPEESHGQGRLLGS